MTFEKADEKKAVHFLDLGYSFAQLSIKPFIKITDQDPFVRLAYELGCFKKFKVLKYCLPSF